MNNGQLLNNLLGITSTNTAATKAAANSARLESSEKFQRAFEQARPEVAARKPAARKNTPAHEAPDAARPVAKAAPQRHAQADSIKADAHSKSRVAAAEDSNKTASSETSKPESVESSAPTTTAQEQTPADTTADDTGLIADPALVVLGQSNGLLNAEDGVFEEIDTSLIPADEAAAEDETGALLTLDSAQLLPDLGLNPLATPAPANTAATATASQTLIGQVTALAGGQALGIQSGLATDEGDGLTLEVSAEGDLSGDTTGGDNPDFLLLNSKVLLHKLTEANMSASVQAEGNSLVDPAKPAVATAVESLLRLTDSQSPAARGFVVQTGVPVAVGSPQWTQAVGDKVLWLAAQNVSAAEIRLDPPELGPMQVKVSVNQDQASVTFTSPHPVVREALDQQLNRLREMFSEQGLNLVNVDVSDKSFAQQERDQQESAKNTNTDLDDEDLEPVGISQAVSMRLVDHYA